MAANFPNSPATGDSYALGGVTYVYDGSAWKGAVGVGNVLAIQVFTADGTYTPTTGMEYCIVEAVGGGGGGGGVDGDVAYSLKAAGGGSGGYSRKLLSAATIGASKAVDIGAGGTGGTAGVNSGNNGSDTTLGTTLVVAKGGTGGAGASTGVLGAPGAGGVAGTGDVTIVGNLGESAVWINDTTARGCSMSTPSILGGRTGANLPGTGLVTGPNGAANTGSGGGGGWSRASATDSAGGDGGSGIMIITEYTRSSPIPGVSSSTDNAIVRFNGTAGLCQDSPNAYIDDNGAMTLESDGTAATGPSLTFYHNSASPAAADIIGGMYTYGEDSGGNTTSYGYLLGVITDPTDASEDSYWQLGMLSAGAITAFNFVPGGIQFPATQIPVASANTLDDYEEGTWTVGVSFGGGTTGITYGGQAGYYTKVGRFVQYHGDLLLSNNGSSTGTALLTGFPFANAIGFPAGAGVVFQGASAATGLNHYIASGGTTANIRIPGAAASTAATEANILDTFYYLFSGVYHA
jgi:hypothetical protein